MSTEERKEQSKKNAGAGLSRTEIARRAYARAQAETEACRIRLEAAIAAEGKNGDKHAKKAEKAKAAIARLLSEDADLQAQARRILAELDENSTTTAS